MLWILTISLLAFSRSISVNWPVNDLNSLIISGTDMLATEVDVPSLDVDGVDGNNCCLLDCWLVDEVVAAVLLGVVIVVEVADETDNDELVVERAGVLAFKSMSSPISLAKKDCDIGRHTFK